MSVIRKTKQEKEEIENLLSQLLSKIEKYNITGYELSKEVGMSEPGLTKIIKGVTKYPKLNILQSIDRYISSNYEKLHQVNEDKEQYTPSKDMPGWEIILEKLITIEDKIDKSSIKQEIIFEIIKNAKHEELKYIEKMVKDKLSS